MSLEKFGNRSEDNGKDSPQVILALIHQEIKALALGAIEVKSNLEKYREKFETELLKHQEDDDNRFNRLADTLQVNQLTSSSDTKKVSNDIQSLSVQVNRQAGGIIVVGWILTFVVGILGVWAVVRFH